MDEYKEILRQLHEALRDENRNNPGFHMTARVSLDKIASTVKEIIRTLTVDDIIVIPDCNRDKYERYAIYRKIEI